MLDLYRMEMMPLFPFVLIPPQITTAELLRDNPVLYMAIMAVACQDDLDVQLELAKMCRQEIGHKVWIQTEKSLDLVQGILVLLAWQV